MMGMNVWQSTIALGAPMVLPEVLNEVEAEQRRRSHQDVFRAYFA